MPASLVPGATVAERYRLEARLGTGEVCSVWRATDERLGRRVALRVFDEDLDHEDLSERAALAASLTHPRVVRLFDTGFDGGRFFAVSELLDRSLADGSRPLSPEETIRIGAQVAEALHYAHERGLAHGHLHPGNVLLSEQGAKVADISLSAERVASSDPAPSTTDDLVGLGRILYRALTGVAPTPGAPADRVPDDPPGLARVVLGLLDGGYDSAARALEDLRRLRRPRGPIPEKRRPRGLLIGSVLILVALVVFGLTRLGDFGGDDPRTPPERITGTPLAVASVDDYDPLGDETEGASTVDRIADGDPRTFWSTERYQDRPDFAGLKDGVGVILDLGEPLEVGKAQLLMPAAGCSFEIRYSEERAAEPEGWTVAGAVADAGTTAPVVFEEPATSRYWLVWLTELTQGVPGIRGQFGCAIGEAQLYAP